MQQRNTRSQSASKPKRRKPRHQAGSSGHAKNSAGRGSQPKPRQSTKRKVKEIDRRHFVNTAVTIETADKYEPRNEFADFGLSQRLLSNVAGRGYVAPTEIQDLSIEPILEGKDLIGLADTGTGKTAAFVLPIIELLTSESAFGTTLVITPTRELAGQIEDEFHAFARGMGLKSALCVGGTGINKQIAALKRWPQLIVGTPGRLKDLLGTGKLPVREIEVLVLDEADRMLDMGFIRDVREIAGALDKDRQSLCFSATITPEIERLLEDFLRDPVTVSVRRRLTNDHIEQRVIEASDRNHKTEILTGLLREPAYEKVIVFARTKHGAQRLADKLVKVGLKAQAIHGNKSQSQRQRSLAAFKDDRARILVATDVASRGLDIPDVSHVINFDQPETHDDYIHRIGRTGRAGNGGNALTFVEVG
jgi:superfamily II DNA/RNA helicase